MAVTPICNCGPCQGHARLAQRYRATAIVGLAIYPDNYTCFHLVQTSILRPFLTLCWLPRASKQHCSGTLAAAIIGLTMPDNYWSPLFAIGITFCLALANKHSAKNERIVSKFQTRWKCSDTKNSINVSFLQAFALQDQRMSKMGVILKSE